MAGPLLTGIVVHWHDEEGVRRLDRAWPEDARCDLLVVDNGSDEPLELTRGRVVRPARNLGFAGGVNFGAGETTTPYLLVLNSDVIPAEGAVAALLDGLEQHGDAAGVVPKLVGEDGESQHRWQLRSLPSPWTLFLQALLLPAGKGTRAEPRPGAAIEQPAGAALALRRSALDQVGGFDESFYPAWFEDVDFARRLHAVKLDLIYHPSALFQHRQGQAVPRLGYSLFLRLYYQNLVRYLRKHHRSISFLARPFIVVGMTVRLLLLPIRKPQRAATRVEAARALAATARAAISGHWTD